MQPAPPRARTHGPTRRPSRARVVVGIVLAASLLATGCQRSQRMEVDSVTDGGGTLRCAAGESFINELSDADPASFGAWTDARRDLYCTNEDAGPLWWELLDVQARKYRGGALCAVTVRDIAVAARMASASGSATCAAQGDDQMYVIGTHGAVRPGGDPAAPRRALSLTPAVRTR